MNPNRKSILRRRLLIGILAALFVLALVSCHGHEGNHLAPRPLITSMQPGAPLVDAVYYGGFNGYAVSVRPGSLYKISVTAMSDDVDLLYFGTDGSFYFPGTCSINNTAQSGVASEDCVVVAPGNVIYFGVDGTYLTFDTAVYTVDVEELAVTDLALSLPLAESKNIMTAGLYAVPVAPGADITAAVTGLNNDADLYVFANNDLTTQTACIIDNTRFTGTTPEDCTVTAGTNTLYFVVDPIFSSSSTMRYTALAALSPSVAAPSNEGSAGTPLALALDVPLIGQAGYQGTSYYKAPVTAGTRYTVSILGLTNNGNLVVYNDDSTFTTPAACAIDNTFFANTTPEDCTLTAHGSTLYFTVEANTQSGGVAYITLVSPGP